MGSKLILIIFGLPPRNSSLEFTCLVGYLVLHFRIAVFKPLQFDRRKEAAICEKSPKCFSTLQVLISWAHGTFQVPLKGKFWLLQRDSVKNWLANEPQASSRLKQHNSVDKMMPNSLVIGQVVVMHGMASKHLLVINQVLLYVTGGAYSNQSAKQFHSPLATVTFDTDFHIQQLDLQGPYQAHLHTWKNGQCKNI